MVLRIPGHRIAHTGDREAVVGATILLDRSKAQGRQNGGAPPILEAEGARPSCWDIREPGPTTSAPTSKACWVRIAFPTP